MPTSRADPRAGGFYALVVAILLVILFVVVPLAELAVVVAAANSFGLGVTLASLLAFSVAGAWLMKREGVAVWRRANQELAAGRPPAGELLDGAMILAGGALLLTPGFITDFVGLMLLLPPVRAVIRPVALRAMARRATAVVSSATTPGFGSAGGGFRTVIIDTDLFEADRADAGRPEATAKVIRVEPADEGGSPTGDPRTLRSGD